MKKILRKIAKIILAIILLIMLIIPQTVINADVGNFEQYHEKKITIEDILDIFDNDDHIDYSRGLSLREIVFVLLALVLFIIGIVLISMILEKIRKKKNQKLEMEQEEERKIEQKEEEEILKSIKKVDSKFDYEKFKEFCSNVYVKLQEIWSERNIDELKKYETNLLFEQHKTQLQEYIDKGQRNVMSDVSVQDMLLTDFKQETGNDIIKIELLAEQVDYIADAKTDRVILGSSKLIKERLYELTFIRKTGTSEWLLLNLVRIEK